MVVEAATPMPVRPWLTPTRCA